VDGGHAPLVDLLLARGADVGLKDSQGDTALEYAELCEYGELAARLVSVVGWCGRGGLFGVWMVWLGGLFGWWGDRDLSGSDFTHTHQYQRRAMAEGPQPT
jgi:ankyrin repeat protein